MQRLENPLCIHKRHPLACRVGILYGGADGDHLEIRKLFCKYAALQTCMNGKKFALVKKFSHYIGNCFGKIAHLGFPCRIWILEPDSEPFRFEHFGQAILDALKA